MGIREAEQRRCERRPGATLRQELVLRMAAMARHPKLDQAGVVVSVVHPADRELRARCTELTPVAPDAYEGTSVRLAVTRRDTLVGTGRVTLWSPVVGFMLEHEGIDAEVPLPLGPRTAEFSRFAVDVTAPRYDVLVALTTLASRVADAHGIDHLYVVGEADDIGSLAPNEFMRLAATVTVARCRQQPR